MSTPRTDLNPEGGLELVYSADVLDRELLDRARELSAGVASGRLAEIFDRDLARHIVNAPRMVQERLASPFTVMVVGDFKRGKSTLINALVGQDVAPVDVQPETISINRIEYADEFIARVQSKDGGEAGIRREDLRRERLEPLLRRLPSPLRHLRVGLPVAALRHVTFIDTPGLGDLFNEFDETVRDYVEQADLIVYVLSSTSPLSMTEQEFLLAAIAPRHFPKVFFLINSTDVFASQEQEKKVADLVRSKLNRIMPGSTLYAISALDEWSRVSGGARPKPARAAALEQSFAAFRRDLEDAIRFRQRYFLLDRAARNFGVLVENVERRTAGLQEALRRDVEQLDAAVRALEEGRHKKSKEFLAASEALEIGFEALRREAGGWMAEFLDRLQADCFARLSSLKSSQIRQHLAFFLKDRFQRAVESCLTAHQPAMTELFESYAKGMQANAAAMLQAASAASGPIATPEMRWTNLQTAEVLADLLPITAALRIGFAIFVRQQKDAHSSTLVDDIVARLPELREQVNAQIRDTYSALKDRVVAAWSTRHEADLQAHLADWKRAVELRESGTGRVQQAQARLAEVQELLAAQRAFVEQFQPKVWSGISAAVAAG